MTIRTPTRETPFKLAYESEAVIPTDGQPQGDEVLGWGKWRTTSY